LNASGTAGPVELRHPPIVIGALDGADFLALELRPGGQLRRFLRQHVGAAGIVIGLDHADDLAALRRVAQRRDDQVDTALLQEFHPVGGCHRHRLELDAEPLGDVLGEVRLHADDLAAGIDEAPGLVVILDADDDGAALLDLGERVLRRGRLGNRGDKRNRGAERDGEFFQHWIYLASCCSPLAAKFAAPAFL
jgi:hypothetical protein